MTKALGAAPTKAKLTAFYSWQSDLPDKTNRNAIRDALRAAAKSIGNIVIDEATRDTAGSVNIPAKIMEKIGQADIFVADISTINASDPTGRKCPNPNVVFELGVAVATLGWERIVLLFNTEFGSFPADLPFDFDRHRAAPYSLGETPGTGDKKALQDLAKGALSAIVKINPKRPSELKGLTRSQIEHNRDIESLRWALEALHLPTLDQHINELPHRINDRIFFFYDSLQAVLSSNSLFYLHDQKLWDALDELLRAWSETLSHAGSYHETAGGHAHIFTNPMDMPLSGQKAKIWDAIETAGREMRAALDEVLRRVRADYVEIDPRETNKKAWADYVAFAEYAAS